MHASYNSKYGKIKNEREVLMTKTEVIQRLQKDLGIPRFIEDKYYSEEEYDQLKKDFEAYFTNYVSNVSADFEGGLENK
jgi:predicted solute-binding protein